MGMLEAIVDNILVDFKSFVERERRDPEVIALSILLYQQGLSLRRVQETMGYLDQDITYRGVHYWIQKLGSELEWNNGKLPNKVVVDETVVKVGGERWYLYAAINPNDRRIVYAAIYPTRNSMTTKSFFKDIELIYGEKPGTAIVDGGPWYNIVTRLGIKQKVVSGGTRNYIERWFQTLKRRTEVFYTNFPDSKDIKHINRWLKTFIYYYNRLRKHQGINCKTPKKVLN